MKINSNFSLEDFRKSLDNIDQAMFFLFSERFRITRKVGKLKQEKNLSSQDKSREKSQFDRIEKLSKSLNLDPEFMKKLYRQIIDQVISEHETFKKKELKFSKKLDEFPEYIFSVLSKKVKKLEKENPDKKILNFGPGNPNFPPKMSYLEKLNEFYLEKNSHFYPGYGAIDEFSSGIKNYYKTRFNVELENNEIYPLLGGKDAITHLPIVFLDENSEVLIPDPGYPAFSGSVSLFGGKPVYYNLLEKNDFKIDFNELEKLVNYKTRFIYLNFPSNPTGRIADISELKKIVQFCKKHEIFIVYDHAYSEITFNDDFKSRSILEISEAKNISIEIGSLSKTFSFAGFRMAYIVGNSEIINKLAKVKTQVDSGMSIPLQKLVGHVFKNFHKKENQTWIQKMQNHYYLNRKKIIDFLNKNLEKNLNLNLKNSDFPKSSLYLWAKIPDSFSDSFEYSMKVLEEKRILLTPGIAFGKNGKNFVRISICANL